MKFRMKAAAFALAGVGVIALSAPSAFADDCGPRGGYARSRSVHDVHRPRGQYVRSHVTRYRAPRVVVRARPVYVTPYVSSGWLYPDRYSCR